MTHSGTPGPKRARALTAIVVVAVLVVALAGVTVGYLLLRTTGSPQQTAASYLQAWQRGSYPAMEKVSVNGPPSGVAGPLPRSRCGGRGAGGGRRPLPPPTRPPQPPPLAPGGDAAVGPAEPALVGEL